ncbi:MAG TPA: hypothetical protein EYP21_02370 [Syntrophaceae bacterium]|nr:hypothetical protein [Syntrophaceae bacterium]
MRKAKTIIMLWALLAICQMAYADDFCKSEFVRSWELDRDAAVVRLIKLWLSKAPEERLNQEIFTITQKEIHMATCCPPFDIDDFYITYLKNPQSEDIPLVVLKTYLMRNGIDLDTKGYFAGKTFYVIRRGD